MGPNVLAYIAVQAGQFHQSISKIQQLLEQKFGLRFSLGVISEAKGWVSAMLSSPFVHADDKCFWKAFEQC